MTTSSFGETLPADLAFLVRHGFDAATLEISAEYAAAWGVSGSEAALATGAVGAEDYHRALAAELALPFLEPGFEVHPLARYPHAILSGIAPLAPGSIASFVLAPQGEIVADLLRRKTTLAPGLAITAPAPLREAVFRARGPAIAALASAQLARERPQHSFHAGPTWRQTLVILVIAVLVVLAALAGAHRALLACVALLGLPFLVLSASKIAAILHPAPLAMPPALPRIPDAELPVYTVLVPLHREEKVLPKLRDALGALDYPAARLDVKLLIEEGDRLTKEAARRIAWPGFVETVLVPDGAPRTKPRALNVGLLLARGEHVVVYDAEDVPDPGQLRDAVALFARSDPDVACLQARLVIDNTADGWLTRFFTVEYGGLFDILNPALARFGLPVPLGGTSNHLRTGILRAVGGWDPWNVTEDADLGIRLALAGYRVADLPSDTHEEAPSGLASWLAQRARWMKGYVQVAITHSRRPASGLRALGPRRFAAASLLTGGAVLSAAIFPLFTLPILAQLALGAYFTREGWLDWAGAVLSLSLLVSGWLALVLPPLAAIARRGWWRLVPMALLMPLYQLLIGLGAWRGLLELVIDPDRWNKTEHGLARTSRNGTGGGSGSL